MTARKTLILALAAVLLAALALWYSAARRPSQEAALQSPALPGLAERLSEIDKVTVTGAGGAVVATLIRKADSWELAERAHPADAGSLRSLLLGIAEARRVEAKTARPELYDRLGVEDITQAGAQGVQLTIEGGGEPLTLIVGHNISRGAGTYIRLASEAQSWQIDRNIAVEKSTASWLDKSLTDIAPDRVERVQVRAGDDEVEIIASERASGDFVIANLPKGRAAQSDYVADATAGFLQGLRLDDVADAKAQPVLDPARTAVFSLRDGLDITVTSWSVDGKPWAQLSASIDDARASAAIDAEQAALRADWEAGQAKLDDQAAVGDGSAGPGAAAKDADAPAAAADASPEAGAESAGLAPEAPLAVRDAAADRAQRLAALEAEITRLNDGFAGRSFLLPTFKASNLNRELEAYLKPRG